MVVANVRTPGQRVTIRPAAQADGLVPGTIFVTNDTPFNSTTQQYTGPGSVTIYRPGASGDARPEAVITKGIDGANDLTVDASGDLWVSNTLSDSVVEYSRAELAKANPAPTVTIGLGVGAYGVAFDPSGNLWVETGGAGLEEINKAELAKSGSPAPVFTLSESLCRFGFDSSGDLWEGGGDQGNSLWEWTKSQLALANAPLTPKVAITPPWLTVGGTVPNGGIGGMGCKPVFDRAGDLWTTNFTHLLEYTKAQLAKSGSVAPRVVISSPGFSNLVDAAFDPSGDLWVPNALPGGDNHSGHSDVVEFTKAELAKSGAVTAARTISGPDTGLRYSIGVAIEP